MAFLNDIESKHLSTFVLVTIGDDICISTQKITFDDKYYKPILLNIPSISESLDIEQRKYKISSVSLSISDYEEDGERFSDTLNTLMNKEVNIYYSSPSCSDLNDCYKAGTYIVRSFSQDEDKVTLNCEDLSQDKLHKDLPLESLPDDDIILDKYRGKPIPMVFGAVDRSPCVIDGSGDDKLIISDYNPDSNFNYNKESFSIGENNTYINSPLYIFNNDSYVNIADKKPFTNSSTLSNNGIINFTEDIDNGRIILESSIENNDTSLENLRIISVRKPVNIGEVIASNQGSSYLGDAYLNLWNPNSAKEDTSDYASLSGEETQPDPTSEEPQLLGSIDPRRANSDFDIYDQDYWSKSFYVKFENVSNINTSDIVLDEDENPVDNFTWIYYKFQHANSVVNTVFPRWDIRVGDVYGSEYLLEPTESEELHDSINGNTPVLKANNFSITDAGKRIIIGYGRNTIISEGDELLYCRAKLYHIFIIHSAVIKGIDKYNFFTNTIGRKGSAPSSQSIYSEILSELDFDEELIQEQLNDIELGQYAFTVDKKTDSKKLIEELSQSTPLYPYFKDGEFRIKSIKTDYDGTNNIIKAEDVIKYKYDRTKIEKVYSRVNVKYHYDYGLKDFTKETDFVSANQLASIDGYLIGDNEDYFGQDFDQEFVFESKYIRHSETALNLAKYLVGLHANQHNIINLTLPLNYLTLELGDIVKFDSLIQGRKIFGEDYTINQSRNGQNIYPYFFVEQIKKSLDKVEVKLYQLHNFSFDNSIIYGCIESQADNYNPNANTDDGSCIMPDLVEGCTNPNSLNYNPNAQEDNGTCVNQLQLLPPEIIAPTDGQVFPIEFTAEELGNNLIPSPADNSTFNTTSSTTGEFFATTATEGSALGYITIFYDGLEIQTADDWYNVTVSNVSTFQFERPIIEANGNVEDGWNLRVENMTFSAGDNVRFALQAYTDSTWNITTTGAGGFILQDGHLGVFQSNSDGDFGFLLDINENLSEGSTYRLSFKHKMLQGSPDNLFVSLGGITSDSITPNVSGEWAEASVDLTMSSDSVNPTISIYIEQAEYTGFTDLYIDDVYLKEVLNEGGVDIPQAIVEWNPSPNLISEISELGLTTTGAYYYKIEDLDGNYSHNLFPIPASNSINSIVIDFDQVNIPQNVLLKLTIGCYSEQTYQGNPVFTSDNIINELPVAEDYTFFSWGEVDDIIDGDIVLGDVNMDGAIDVADIVLMVSYILGTTVLDNEQIKAADIVEDGLVNVSDVVGVINTILENSGGGNTDTGSEE